MSTDIAATDTIAPDLLVAALKAVAEPTRLRMLVLLGSGELNVTDFTRILGQSQPRISRHLKLLVDAGLVERFQEGSFAYFRLAERVASGELARSLVATLDLSSGQFARDGLRRDALMQERVAGAQAFFEAAAQEWDRIRGLHIEEAAVEVAMREAVGPGPFDLFVDIGTGTGRILELFASHYEHGLGIDINKAMLGYARARLEARGLRHVQVRHGDLYNLSNGDGTADVVVMHQVLHYLARPSEAIREAARILKPGGQLLIVDFAPHEVEFLRDEYAHVRLGCSQTEMRDWLEGAGVSARPVRALSSVVRPKGRQRTLTVCIWNGVRRREMLPAPGRVEASLQTMDSA